MDGTLHRFSNRALAGLIICQAAACMFFSAVAAAKELEVDPDLSRAMSYDGEFNDGNPSHCDQSLAEKYYLLYLVRCSDPSERARVYTQLGLLFNTNYHREKGEKPNYAKARGYFSEAIRAEPDRIGLPTIRARYGMATPDQSPEERLKLRIETSKWLSKVDHALPNQGLLLGDLGRSPRESDTRSLLGYITQLQQSDAANMLYEARRAADPAKSLKEIVQQLPGTAAAAAAQEKLNVWKNRASARAVGTPSPATTANAPPLNNNIVDIPPRPGTTRRLSSTSDGVTSVWILIPAAVLVGLGIVSYCLYRRLNARNN